MEEYDEIVEQLKLEWKKGKKKRNKSVIKTCMEKTSILRQKWVMEEKPLISQVLCKFPPLRESRQVSFDECQSIYHNICNRFARNFVALLIKKISRTLRKNGLNGSAK